MTFYKSHSKAELIDIIRLTNIPTAKGYKQFKKKQLKRIVYDYWEKKFCK